MSSNDHLLYTSEVHFRQVWETTSDALVLSDQAGYVLAVNPAYLDLYGYTADQVLGHSFAIIFPVEQRAWAQRQYQLVFAGETDPTSFESVVRRADGVERIVESRATFLHDHTGHRTAMLSTIRDITERKVAEAALQQAHTELERRVIERTRELSAINERLRVEIAERKQIEAQLHQVAATLTRVEQEERRRISQILHDDLQQQLYGIQIRLQMMLLTAKSKGDVVVATELQETCTWLDSALRTTRQLTVDLSPPILKDEGLADALGWLASQMAETQGLHVTIKAPHAFPIADQDLRVLLFQAVRELLFNVVKHAATNQAQVELQEQADGGLGIQVSDDGRGFDVAIAEATHTGRFGLFSVRERVELFGGQMAIHSKSGHGTMVTLNIPIST